MELNPAKDVAVHIKETGYQIEFGMHFAIEVPLLEKITFGLSMFYELKPNVQEGTSDSAFKVSPSLSRVNPQSLDIKYGNLPEFVFELPQWLFFYNEFLPELHHLQTFELPRAAFGGFKISKPETTYSNRKAHYSLKLSLDK